MGKYVIVTTPELDRALIGRAVAEHKPPEELIAELMYLLLVRPHNMNEDDMRTGYEECGGINLEWAGEKSRE